VAGTCESSIILVALCVAAPARAQTSPTLTVDDYRARAEITAGISMQAPRDVNLLPDCEKLGLPCGSGKEFPDFGVILSVASYRGDAIGVVGELSVYKDSWDSYGSSCPYPLGPPPCVVTQTNHVASALAGVKVRSRLLKIAGLGPPTHGRLFLQLLAGPQWSGVGPRRFVLQPGAGLDHYLRNGLTVHAEASYRFAPNRNRDLSTARFLVGIGIPIGSISDTRLM
jgi:hypothetical protein